MFRFFRALFSRQRYVYPWKVGDAHPMPLAGHIWEPVTELVLLAEGCRPKIDVVARPTEVEWPALRAILWPTPDPSKRWRLFIQEDTRP